MKRLLIPLLIATALPAASQSPTWADDVACILYSHCTSCHHPGGISGDQVDLTSYTESVAHRDDIAGYVTYRAMPPWPPDENYRRLAHERVLTQDEIDIVAAWAEADGPQGNMANAPSVPVYGSNAELTSPDLTSRMEDYVIPSSTSDIYQCFVLPIDNVEDNYIKRLEVIPGNRQVVHHVLVYQDTSGQAQALDDAEPGAGYPGFGGIGVEGAPLIGVWVPGAPVMSTPDGMGIKLLAGADIVIQVHYPQGSEGQLDSTRVNIEFTPPGFTRDLAIAPALYHAPPSLQEGLLAIPPNEVITFHEQFELPIPATITAIGPHAHLLCSSMKAWAITPDQDSVPLIDIPEWDFHWQGMYEFRNPIYLPLGSMLYGEATYDNTAANEENPNDPPQWVFVGEATTDEMMLFYFAYTFGFPSDTLIVVDDSEHGEHHENCTTDFNIGLSEAGKATSVRIVPIPASDRIIISVGGGHGPHLRLIDAQGRTALTEVLMRGDNGVSIAGLARGTYIAEVRDAAGEVLHRSPLLLQ